MSGLLFTDSTNDNSRHLCPGPSCKRLIPNHLYACGWHWSNLPFEIRMAIFRNYVPGQTAATMTDAYRNAIQVAEEYWRK